MPLEKGRNKQITRIIQTMSYKGGLSMSDMRMLLHIWNMDGANCPDMAEEFEINLGCVASTKNRLMKLNFIKIENTFKRYGMGNGINIYSITHAGEKEISKILRLTPNN